MKQEYSTNLNNFQELVPHHSSKGLTATSPDDEGTKEHFKKAHYKSTLILFSIAAIFLFCNIPRLAVKIFHVYLQGRSVQKHYNECAAAGQFHAPVGILIMSKFSNFQSMSLSNTKNPKSKNIDLNDITIFSIFHRLRKPLASRAELIYKLYHLLLFCKTI